jgi:5S rRNA maturation endonuclease (ribonuclease M5)
MNNSDLILKIDELFDELCLANETIPIIVEGMNDEATLRQIGAKGVIIKLNIGSSILNFCEDIGRKYDEVILLPDWDNKGKQIFKKLVQNFKLTPIKVNENFWRHFKKFCSKDIQSVEYLNKYRTELSDIQIH